MTEPQNGDYFQSQVRELHRLAIIAQGEHSNWGIRCDACKAETAMKRILTPQFVAILTQGAVAATCTKVNSSPELLL